MEIEQAKKIHHIVMKVLMHTHGIGEIKDSDVIAAKEISLIEMSQANSLMEGYKEGSEKNGFKNFVTTSDITIAAFYIRLHDDEFMIATEFMEIIEAMDNAFDETDNGHGIIIRAPDHYQLVELTLSGDGTEKTLASVHTSSELYNYAKSRVTEVEPSF